jgi:hypothetical protein
MRPKTKLRIGALLAASVWSVVASAQTSVNEKRPAAPDGVIAIDVPNGTVDVKGWANQEIQVTGTVAQPDMPKISGDQRNLQVTLMPAQADIEIRVPAGCTVRIKGVKTSIRASGVTGTVAAETAEGDIAVSNASTVDVRAVKGKVDLSGSVQRASVHAINDGVSVKGGAGEISVSSVGGPIVVVGDKFSHVRLATISGHAEFEGKLDATTDLNAQSVSGAIKVTLASGTGADVAVRTLSGKIENGLGSADAQSVSQGPKQTLAFSTGGGGAKVSIQTLSGAIVLSKK